MTHRSDAGHRPRAAPAPGRAARPISQIPRQPPVDKIIEAGQLFQPDLAAELVEARDAALAVANDVERRHVDLAVETRPEIEVLQELRMIVQQQQPEALASDGERPVGEPALVHPGGRLAAERIDDRDPLANDIGFVELRGTRACRHQRMQPVDRDELLREVERRAEVVDPAVHVIGVGQVPAVDEAVAPRIAETDDACAGDKRGEELVPFLAVGRFAELAHDLLEGVARPAENRRTGPTSWSSCRGRAARRRGAVASTRSCGSWRSRPRRSGARPRTIPRR